MHTATTLIRKTSCAFGRAQEILRREGRLTTAECEELEALFEEVDGSQFLALIHDPAHTRSLREYDRYVWRPALPVLATVVALLFVSIATAVLVGVRF